ncbi:MAG TPA: primase-helicase family protein [Verrucomicrobiae bacterium]|nr:primase-helicase family protein [Verrucomicrobiae bacterium]
MIPSDFIPFFTAPNLLADEVTEARPWQFAPGQPTLDQMRGLPKLKRTELLQKPGTEWNVYTAARGVGERRRICTENPVGAMRGLVVDYDAPSSFEAAVGYLTKAKCLFEPNLLEHSLSGNLRLVWCFGRELLIPDAEFYSHMINVLHKALGVEYLLPQFDPNSRKAAQVYINGGEWHLHNPKPVPWEALIGLLMKAGKELDTGTRDEIPLATIAKEVENRFPGRWKGPFELNNTGVRFWDKNADCPTGCQVKPDGMLCFTGHTGFMKWEAIFGATWANEQRVLNLGRHAEGKHFDGRIYWKENMNQWKDVCREDLLLALKISGVATKPRRGQVASDAEAVLNYIQTFNRIDGAAPIVNRKPGLIVLDGQRILNTSTIRALQPADASNVSPAQFPFVWDLVSNLFASTEQGSLNSWLAWMKRFYLAVLQYRALMGQAIFLCGPKDCGKTLLVYRVIKPLVGDKAANPYSFFTGETPFNSELFQSPLLMINDEEALPNFQVKSRFQARLKSFVVNPSHTYHKKFAAPISVEWTGRLVSTLNDDPSSVGLLPEVNSNTNDKIMFFRAKERLKPWEDADIIEAKIGAELPFFARFLLEWEPPKELMIGGRMGVKSFFDPDILAKSIQQNSHFRLMEVIMLWFDNDPKWKPENERDVWEGDATRLFSELSAQETMGAVMREWNSTKCAIALTTLARIQNSGVSHVEGKEGVFRITRSIILRQASVEPSPKNP